MIRCIEIGPLNESNSPDFNGSSLTHFEATLSSAQDYYPGGMIMPGRSFSSGYRFGFNGMENDDEVSGSGNSLDFGARIYDPRVGRWLSRDPMEKMLVPWSPYAFSLDNPIYFTDPAGEIPWPVPLKWIYKNTTIIRKISSVFGPRWGRNHNGIDINLGANYQDLGVPIFATHDGTVIAVKPFTDGDDGGNRIYIKSNDGKVQTWYMHLDEFTEGIAVGQTVREGDIIGSVGGSGKGAGKAVYSDDGKVTEGQPVHLHYEIRVWDSEKMQFVPISPLGKDNDRGIPIDPQTELLGLPSNFGNVKSQAEHAEIQISFLQNMIQFYRDRIKTNQKLMEKSSNTSDRQYYESKIDQYQNKIDATCSEIECLEGN